MWDFHDFPGAFPVNVVEVIPDEKIVLRWKANEGQAEGRADEPYYNDCVFTFEPLDGDTRTLVSVSEGSWHETPAGLKGAFGNCFGWSQMICAMKAWLEYGINLREGASNKRGQAGWRLRDASRPPIPPPTSLSVWLSR